MQTMSKTSQGRSEALMLLNSEHETVVHTSCIQPCNRLNIGNLTLGNVPQAVIRVAVGPDKVSGQLSVIHHHQTFRHQPFLPAVRWD